MRRQQSAAGRDRVSVGVWVAWGFLWLIQAGIAMGGVLLIVRGVDAARAEYAGVAGEVRVTECRRFEGKADGWTCRGPFTSDDGKLRLPRVTIEPYLAEKPTSPIAVRVAGDGATQAWVPSLVPLTALGGGLAFLGIAGWSARRMVRDGPEGAS